MAAEADPDIAMTAAGMPIGGQMKDSSLRSLPMETFVPALEHSREQTTQVGCLILFMIMMFHRHFSLIVLYTLH